MKFFVRVVGWHTSSAAMKSCWFVEQFVREYYSFHRVRSGLSGSIMSGLLNYAMLHSFVVRQLLLHISMRRSFGQVSPNSSLHPRQHG
jgi:hypothetical protein